MKHKKIFILYLLTIINISIKCDDIITFFLRPFPEAQDASTAAKRVEKIGKPGKLPKYTLKALTQNHFTSGIFCTYNGYLTASDLDGQVIFPRKHKEPKVTIVVAKSITPVIMIENTVHHFEIADRNNAKMYEMERKTDKATRTYFWDTKEKTPKDNIISTDSIVIIAMPKHVYVPTGITLTTKDPQLLLPDIYVKRNIEKLANSLYMFNIKNFLAPIDNIYKKDKMSYSQQIKQ